MTAAALARMVKFAGVSVTLVESEELGTVGVGEATIPSLHSFNALLDVDENEFVRQTNATFKLGIEFVDWYRSGHRYMHPFGVFGRDLLGVNFHQLWLRMRTDPGFAKEAGALSDFNLTAIAAKSNRFMRPQGGPTAVFAALRYAFHFDAGAYASFLRRYAEARGVKRIEGKVIDVRQRQLDGHIEQLILQDGRRIDGELFVDCSGFRALLIGQTLKVGFESWADLLECDRAVAVPSQRREPLTPYTRSTADRAGWRWRIPLQHRTGNGYTYSSRYISDDEATATLLAALDGPALAEPRSLRFVPGRRRKFWHKNCVAIGLAAGFLEPLESTSIHLIQTGITKLLGFFPDKTFSPQLMQEFNRRSEREYEHVRDFIVLHYRATERADSPFWSACRDGAMPETLAEKLAMFRESGRVLRKPDELFTDDSWIAVMLGQGINPLDYDPVVDSFPPDTTTKFAIQIRDLMRRAVDSMPTHEEYIAKHCAASA